MSSSPASDLAEAQRLHRAGQLGAAIQFYEKVLATQPHRSEVLLQLGLAYRGSQQTEAALHAFRQAITLDATCAEAHHQLGNGFKSVGRTLEAIAALQTAASLAPRNAAIWLNLGVSLLTAERTQDAIDSFEQAVALEPGRAEAHNILGVALTSAGRLEAAQDSLQRALRLQPNFPAAHNNLGRIYKAEGLLPEAVAEYRAALEHQPDPGTHSNLLFALNFIPSLAPEDVFLEHREWQKRYTAPLRSPDRPPVSWDGKRRLRVGYVSPDFVHHAVAYFIAPVLAAHDRDRIEIFCYANVPLPDRTTARLRGLAEHWRDISQLSDDAVAGAIREDRIDLLIDLAGHTARHRLLVFARRPAPIQATWIGYPNTTGLDAIDYRFTDAISDPPGETDAWHAEKLVRLPTSFSCYEPDPQAPEVNPLRAREAGVATFGCFNNFAKISPPVVTLWCQLLRALPRANLLLKSRGLADPAVIARVRSAFQAGGIAAERISFNGEELSVAAHLALYHQVDIALDPFPYNGTTTTCEALWMGVPVVTLAGRVHAARVGASLLTHVGLSDWIASTPADYISCAVAAANDLPGLAEVRKSLRGRMRVSALCDAARFTRGLEEAFFKMAGSLSRSATAG